MTSCFSVIAFVTLLWFTSIVVCETRQVPNLWTLYLINKKHITENDHQTSSLPDSSMPFGESDVSFSSPTNSYDSSRQTQVLDNNSVNRNYTSPVENSYWESNGHHLLFNQQPLTSEQWANTIPNLIENFKLITLCDKTLAILDYTNYGDLLQNCELFDLEKNPETAFKKAQTIAVPIQKIDFNTMKDIINRCRQLAEDMSPSSTEEVKNVTFATTDNDSTWGLWRGLIPGTKWCGLGDAAKDYFDLGAKRNIDLCCRAHDHCPIRLKAFRYGYGLINFSLYTKSHCECDEDFHRCLKHVGSDFASTLGNLYFNVMKIQCIKDDDSIACVEKKQIDGKEECIHFRPNKIKTMKFSQPELLF